MAPARPRWGGGGRGRVRSGAVAVNLLLCAADRTAFHSSALFVFLFVSFVLFFFVFFLHIFIFFLSVFFFCCIESRAAPLQSHVFRTWRLGSCSDVQFFFSLSLCLLFDKYSKSLTNSYFVKLIDLITRLTIDRKAMVFLEQ